MIHPSAIIHESAQLHESVEVGPFSYIGENVTIGEGCKIHSHVVIKGPTIIGKRNEFFQFGSIGEKCQDKKYADEPTQLIIGDDNTFREGVSLHRGTIQDESKTVIGSRNLLMTTVHVAHDCVIGDDCILATSATLAGHVKVGNGVIIAGHSGAHQFCQIGDFAMVGMNSSVSKDVPSFVLAHGNPASPVGMNFEGMKRRGYSKELISALRQAYKIVYREADTLEKALIALEPLEQQFAEVKNFADSIRRSNRGIIR